MRKLSELPKNNRLGFDYFADWLIEGRVGILKELRDEFMFYEEEIKMLRDKYEPQSLIDDNRIEIENGDEAEKNAERYANNWQNYKPFIGPSTRSRRVQKSKPKTATKTNSACSKVTAKPGIGSESSHSAESRQQRNQLISHIGEQVQRYTTFRNGTASGDGKIEGGGAIKVNEITIDDDDDEEEDDEDGQEGGESDDEDPLSHCGDPNCHDYSCIIDEIDRMMETEQE